MSGLQRATRHPDRINDPHARARLLASDALVEPLGDADAAWLAGHLDGCAPCRATADGFAADAALLSELRPDPAPAPRDLGARVSLALDGETRTALRRATGRPAAAPRAAFRRPTFALAGVAAAAATIALVVLPLAIPPGPSGSQPGSSLAPAATPIAVDTVPVAWVRKTSDGLYVISSATVDRVCPGADAAACGTLDGGARTLASLDVKPESVILARAGNGAVVVGQGGVYAVTVSVPLPVTTATPASSSAPSTEPVQSPAATGVAASPPADSPSPSGTPTPGPPVSTPSPSPSAAVPTPTLEPATPEPSPEPATASPSATPSEPGTSPGVPTPLPTIPPGTPAPSAATALAIAEGVVLVGAQPAYSPDGRWVAFSARPVDGSHGPDVYVWLAGTEKARPLTSDHATVFSAWRGGTILASSARVRGSDLDASDVPAADADPASAVARSFLLDPATGASAVIPRDDVWRPVVDPTDRMVVYWTGLLSWSPADVAWMPFAGQLETADWMAMLDPMTEPLRTPVPAQAAPDSIADWEIRFDPAGRRLGIWVADPQQPGTGRLALVTVDADGKLGTVDLSDAAALPGFSLDADRLAWSTPPGQNGQGSLVTVYAWRDQFAGQVFSIPDPGNEPVVVAR